MKKIKLELIEGRKLGDFDMKYLQIKNRIILSQKNKYNKLETAISQCEAMICNGS